MKCARCQPGESTRVEFLPGGQGLLSGQPVIARQILRKIIVGRLTLTPKVTPDGRFYEVGGLTTFGRILEGVVRVQSLGPGVTRW
jgi:hypothetical protein